MVLNGTWLRAKLYQRILAASTAVIARYWQHTKLYSSRFYSCHNGCLRSDSNWLKSLSTVPAVREKIFSGLAPKRWQPISECEALPLLYNNLLAHQPSRWFGLAAKKNMSFQGTRPPLGWDTPLRESSMKRKGIFVYRILGWGAPDFSCRCSFVQVYDVGAYVLRAFRSKPPNFSNLAAGPEQARMLVYAQ